MTANFSAHPPAGQQLPKDWRRNASAIGAAADAAAEQDGVEGDDHRHAAAGHDAAEDVSAEVVGPQRVVPGAAILPGRRLEGGGEVEAVGVVG